MVYVAWVFKQKRTIKGGGIYVNKLSVGKTVQMII